jgi:glycosyltransferase involved in cell wall biosynthesis
MPTNLAHDPLSRSATIVMPVRNGQPWIAAAVESVLAQDGIAVDLIVLDGGSTDGTREWLQTQTDSRIRIVLEPDRGQSDAIARGLDSAAGAVLGWLNADDLLEPGALAAVVEAFDGRPGAALVSGVCRTIDPGGNATGRIDLPPDASLQGLLHSLANLPQPATFFRASAYRQTAGIDIELEYAMDVDLWLKLARVGEIVFLRDRVLASFRMHGASKSARGATDQVREDLKVRLRQGLPIWSRTAITLLRWSYLRPIARAARRYLPAGGGT